MKYHQIIAALTEEPLLITPAAHASLIKLFEEHRQLSAEEFQAKREGTDLCGEAVDVDQMEVRDGIAHIPIGGPMGRGFGSFEKGAGAVDVDDVIDELDQAEEDSKVRAAILIIDSPGGMVSGTPELADRVAAFDKPVYAFTSGMMCSAAYWVGCAADMLFATKSADIGSIGVFTAFLDVSERYKTAGARVELITSGKYKGAGLPGTSLTPDQRENMQARINHLASLFHGHVQGCRPDVRIEDMQGQVFNASLALSKGLIDQIVQGKDDVVDLLS